MWESAFEGPVANSSRWKDSEAGGQGWRRIEVKMTSVAAEFDHMEIQQQYGDGVNNRWDADDWDNENSSARLFERSRIKALAGRRMEGWVKQALMF